MDVEEKKKKKEKSQENKDVFWEPYNFHNYSLQHGSKKIATGLLAFVTGVT